MGRVKLGPTVNLSQGSTHRMLGNNMMARLLTPFGPSVHGTSQQSTDNSMQCHSRQPKTHSLACGVSQVD